MQAVGRKPVRLARAALLHGKALPQDLLGSGEIRRATCTIAVPKYAYANSGNRRTTSSKHDSRSLPHAAKPNRKRCRHSFGSSATAVRPASMRLGLAAGAREQECQRGVCFAQARVELHRAASVRDRRAQLAGVRAIAGARGFKAPQVRVCQADIRVGVARIQRDGTLEVANGLRAHQPGSASRA